MKRIHLARALDLLEEYPFGSATELRGSLFKGTFARLLNSGTDTQRDGRGHDKLFLGN